MSAPALTHKTIKQYLDAEREATFKSEYYQGEISGMSGQNGYHLQTLNYFLHKQLIILKRHIQILTTLTIKFKNRKQAMLVKEFAEDVSGAEEINFSEDKKKNGAGKDEHFFKVYGVTEKEF